MKKRNKKYRPRQINVPNIVGNQNVFAAPIQMLHDIRHSSVFTVGDKVIMPSVDHGGAYDAVDTLRLFARILPDYAAATGEVIDVLPITMLANRLESDMPVDDAALAPVERLFELGQRMGNRLTPKQTIVILDGESA